MYIHIPGQKYESGFFSKGVLSLYMYLINIPKRSSIVESATKKKENERGIPAVSANVGLLLRGGAH